MTVGFVGLGKMGAGMAKQLLAKGQELIVWNRSPEAVEALVRQGAKRAADVADAFQADIVVTMLATDASIRETILAPNVLARAQRQLVHIVCSTISVAFAQELAAIHRAEGRGFVSAPVIGRPDVAASGELHVLVAGDDAVVARAEPIIECFARKVWRAGKEPHQANVAKLAVNFTLACAIEAMAESCALARRHGLSPAALMEIFSGTAFGARAYQVYGPIIAGEKFDPAGFALRHGLKDIRQVIEAGEAVGAPLPFASVLRDNFIDAIGHGDADRDWSAIAAVALRCAGI